jgi:hypothetical protein
MADYRNKGMEENEVSWKNPYRAIKLLEKDYKKMSNYPGHQRNPKGWSDISGSVRVCHSEGTRI